MAEWCNAPRPVMIVQPIVLADVRCFRLLSETQRAGAGAEVAKSARKAWGRSVMKLR